MRKWTTFIAAVAALCGTARADAIDDIVAHAMKKAPVAGLSVGVMRGNRIVAERGYGDARKDSVFHIDSVSKNVTAALALMLVDQGRLSLDDPVPGFSGVRVRNLLNHTSGIASFTSLPEWPRREARTLPRAEMLSLIRSRSRDFAPGTSWRYDNSGFYLLGTIVERANARPYGAVTGALFRRLGMRHSSYGCATPGHEVRDGRLAPARPIAWDNAFAAGGLCSTVGDLLTWERALAHGLLSATSLAQMTRPARLADGTTIDYGFGTRLGTLDGHRVRGHTGSGGGFSAVLEYFPDDDLTIAVLIDTGGSLPAQAVATALAREMLHLPGHVVDVPVAHAADYTGIFESDDGALEVFESAGKLAFRAPGTKETLGMLRHQGNDVFALDADTQIRVLRVNGKVAWAIGYEGGLMMDPKRRVQR